MRQNTFCPNFLLQSKHGWVLIPVMKGKKNAGDHIKFSLLGDYEQVLNLLPLSFASVNEVNSIVHCPKIQKNFF